MSKTFNIQYTVVYISKPLITIKRGVYMSKPLIYNIHTAGVYMRVLVVDLDKQTKSRK